MRRTGLRTGSLGRGRSRDGAGPEPGPEPGRPEASPSRSQPFRLPVCLLRAEFRRASCFARSHSRQISADRRVITPKAHRNGPARMPAAVSPTAQLSPKGQSKPRKSPISRRCHFRAPRPATEALTSARRTCHASLNTSTGPICRGTPVPDGWDPAGRLPIAPSRPTGYHGRQDRCE